VWLYLCFCPSYRGVEEIMAQRGVHSARCHCRQARSHAAGMAEIQLDVTQRPRQAIKRSSRGPDRPTLERERRMRGQVGRTCIAISRVLRGYRIALSSRAPFDGPARSYLEVMRGRLMAMARSDPCGLRLFMKLCKATKALENSSVVVFPNQA